MTLMDQILEAHSPTDDDLDYERVLRWLKDPHEPIASDYVDYFYTHSDGSKRCVSVDLSTESKHLDIILKCAKLKSI